MKPIEHALVKFEDKPGFTPSYTPVEMFGLGIFGGGYFQVRTAVPAKFVEDMGSLWPQNKKTDKANNCYKIIGGSSLEWWREKNLIHPDDPNGWVEWYIKFYYGRRHADDDRQIGRFKAFISRHLGMLRNIQSRGSDSVKTKQNLLQWAWNHEIGPLW